MALQKFFHRSRGRGGEFVSVNQSDDLTVSKALVDRCNLNAYAAVQLAYDEEDRMMVLQFLPEKVPGTVPIRPSSPFVLAVKSFVRHLGIQRGRYEAEWDERDKSLVCIYNVCQQEAA